MLTRLVMSGTSDGLDRSAIIHKFLNESLALVNNATVPETAAQPLYVKRGKRLWQKVSLFLSPFRKIILMILTV